MKDASAPRARCARVRGDGDFKAEIVFSANNNVSWGIDAGIEVLQDSLDNWVNTRPVWNQHTYHITNFVPVARSRSASANSVSYVREDITHDLRAPRDVIALLDAA